MHPADLEGNPVWRQKLVDVRIALENTERNGLVEWTLKIAENKGPEVLNSTPKIFDWTKTQKVQNYIYLVSCNHCCK
jgi:hypothetical protein